MTQTLFGGLLAVIFLFFVARRCRLSNYWSGLLSGALPFLAYLGYSASHAQAGDVIAIHLVVYLATAGILGVFNSQQRHQGRMHWAPRLLIAFFALLAILMALFIFIAANGLPPWLATYLLPHAGGKVMHTGFSGALPHDKNKLYEAHQEKIAAQRKLGWQPAWTGLEGLHAGAANTVVLNLQDAAGQPLVADRVLVQLMRLANPKDDVLLEMHAAAPGKYQIEFALPASGNWVLGYRIERGQQSYEMQQPVEVAER